MIKPVTIIIKQGSEVVFNQDFNVEEGDIILVKRENSGIIKMSWKWIIKGGKLVSHNG